MFKKSLTDDARIISFWLLLISLAISISTNVASSQLPESLEPFLWLAWPISIILFCLTVWLTWKTFAEPQPLHVLLAENALREREKVVETETTVSQKFEFLFLSILYKSGMTFISQNLSERYERLAIEQEVLRARRMSRVLINTAKEFELAKDYIEEKFKRREISQEAHAKAIASLDNALDEQLNILLTNTG